MVRERSPTPAAYHKLSITEKRALDLDRVREPAVTCPSCDTQVMPVDLLPHLDQRCPGPRDPGPGARWIPHREVMAMGVPRGTLSRWANNGLVRFTGERQDRKYLYRDLAVKVAQRRGFRRR
jgi:hypothetical protein